MESSGRYIAKQWLAASARKTSRPRFLIQGLPGLEKSTLIKVTKREGEIQVSHPDQAVGVELWVQRLFLDIIGHEFGKDFKALDGQHCEVWRQHVAGGACHKRACA
eukprot:1157347-Pelagomonas_calceolata.AAC.3